MGIDWGNVLTGFTAALLTYLGTKTKAKSDVTSTQVQGQATTESMYIQHMQSLLDEYKDQTDSMRSEIGQVTQRLNELQKEFDDFKSNHDKKIEEYNVLIVDKNENIEALEMEIEELKDENRLLKEELDEIKR